MEDNDDLIISLYEDICNESFSPIPTGDGPRCDFFNDSYKNDRPFYCSLNGSTTVETDKVEGDDKILVDKRKLVLLISTVRSLQLENAILTTNMSSLFKTALNEVSLRKNKLAKMKKKLRAIRDLFQNKDSVYSIPFRRFLRETGNSTALNDLLGSDDEYSMIPQQASEKVSSLEHLYVENRSQNETRLLQKDQDDKQKVFVSSGTIPTNSEDDLLENSTTLGWCDCNVSPILSDS